MIQSPDSQEVLFNGAILTQLLWRTLKGTVHPKPVIITQTHSINNSVHQSINLRNEKQIYVIKE